MRSLEGMNFGGIERLSRTNGDKEISRAATSVDPIFLTDAIEWADGVRPDDFEVECQNEK